MKVCNMSYNVLLSSKSFVTNFTFEWFLYLMNSFNMHFHSALKETAVATKLAFKLFLVLMN